MSVVHFDCATVLQALQTILSTGSVLSPESFDWVSAHHDVPIHDTCVVYSDLPTPPCCCWQVYGSFKADVALASITGGTDILSCFALGQPDAPVRRGELQCAGLGMATAVFGEDGQPVTPGERGELVCTLAFPCAPTGFLNDPDGSKYHSACELPTRSVWLLWFGSLCG